MTLKIAQIGEMGPKRMLLGATLYTFTILELNRDLRGTDHKADLIINILNIHPVCTVIKCPTSRVGEVTLKL